MALDLLMVPKSAAVGVGVGVGDVGTSALVLVAIVDVDKGVPEVSGTGETGGTSEG